MSYNRITAKHTTIKPKEKKKVVIKTNKNLFSVT
jgi:hypothetical protein